MGLFKELFYKSRKTQKELATLLNYTTANLSILKRNEPPYFIKLAKAMETLGIDNLEAHEADLLITIKRKCKELKN
jgi:transcriptional regulator